MRKTGSIRRSALRQGAAAALWAATTASALAAEVSFVGMWECAAVPALGIPAVRVPGEAIRDGDRLSVSRVVHQPGTSTESGRSSGAATIRDGRFAVEMTGPEGRIRGRFEGTVSDGEVVVQGREQINLPDRGQGERACQAMLKRR